jgi:hypothetical protein
MATQENIAQSICPSIQKHGIGEKNPEAEVGQPTIALGERLSLKQVGTQIPRQSGS